MQLDELPQFLKDRVLAMPANIQEAFLSTITPDWVECQIAANEIVKGLEEGKWTIEEVRAAAQRSKA